MNGLCAPSITSTDERLEFLFRERAIINERIAKVILMQNEETGIAIKTMHEVVEYFIENSIDCFDVNTYSDYTHNDWYSLSYMEIIGRIDDFDCEEEPCVKKMLKEHANHILLSK